MSALFQIHLNTCELTIKNNSLQCNIVLLTGIIIRWQIINLNTYNK